MPAEKKIPRTNMQAPENFQSPITNSVSAGSFGIWRLELLWMLELGAWNFFSCVSCVSWLNNSHVKTQNRHHRWQWAVSHRRLHQSKMGESQNAVRRAVR